MNTLLGIHHVTAIVDDPRPSDTERRLPSIRVAGQSPRTRPIQGATKLWSQ
jgi:hypothetical protein